MSRRLLSVCVCAAGVECIYREAVHRGVCVCVALLHPTHTPEDGGVRMDVLEATGRWSFCVSSFQQHTHLTLDSLILKVCVIGKKS